MSFLLSKQQGLFPFLFFLLVSGALIFSWFRFGQYYGGGDVGLPTYNPSKVFEITRFVWWGASAPGYPVPQGVTSAPLEFFLSILQRIGFSTIFLQATLFFILLFLMGFGMYLLILFSFKVNRRLAILGGLFYMFNPYMMVQVWHRFVHTSIILVAVLPFMVIFWQKYIKNRDFSALSLFLLVNLLGVFLYGTIAYIITIWTLLFLLTISEALIPWRNVNSFLKIWELFFIGFILWLLTSSWWLIPSFSIGSGLFNQQHSSNESLSTLFEISKQAILPFSLQLINPFYIFQQAEFGDIYKGLFFKIIPWVSTIVIFIGLLESLKQKVFSKWGLLFVVLVFLAKGAATPFGFSYVWGFSRFFFLGVLRNPFEKMGILLPLAGSILFILGLSVITNWLSKKISSRWTNIVMVFFLLPVIIYSWPMLSGNIFGRIGKPAFIKVPNSYVEADKWIKQNGKEGNILHLPLTRTEGVTYKWEYGYNGVEPSQLIFSSLPSISRGFNVTRLDDTLTGLSLLFEPPYSKNTESILSILQSFNVRFIVLHKDMVWQGSDVYDFIKTEDILNKLTFLQKRGQYGELIIYEIRSEYYKGKFVLSDQVEFVIPEKSTIRMWPWLARLNRGEILTPDDYKNLENQSAQEIMVFPNESFSYLEGSEKGLDIIGSNLVSIIYQLSSTKETIVKRGDKDSEKIITQLITSGEDLINIYLSIRNKNYQIAPLLNRYIQTTNELINEDVRLSKLRFFISENTINDFFKLHLLILEDLKINELLNVQEKLRKDLSNRGLLPTNSYISKEDFAIQPRQINRFQIPKAGKYEIFFTNSQIKDIYHESLNNLNFQIDDKLVTLKATIKGDLISFGEVDLTFGDHELSFNNYLSNNLIPNLEEADKVGEVKFTDKDTFQLTSTGQQAAYIEEDLGSVAGEDNYQIMFEGRFLSGVGFDVQIIQDDDLISNNEVKPRISTVIYRTRNDTNFQSYNFKLPSLGVTTRTAKVRILAEPTTTSLNTILQIKNLKMFRVLDNRIFLKNTAKVENSISQAGHILEYVQKNPVLYMGKIRIDRPSYMIFKESFHPGWELTLINNSQTNKSSKHILANLYSNAWFIENEGEYNFKLEFIPQRKVYIGLYLASFGWITSILLILKSKFKVHIFKLFK